MELVASTTASAALVTTELIIERISVNFDLEQNLQAETHLKQINQDWKSK